MVQDTSSSSSTTRPWNLPSPPAALPAGLDLRAVDLMSDNQMMPYRLPFRVVLPHIMKEMRNPLILPGAAAAAVNDPLIDYSDNDHQLEVIAHHYLNEFNEGHIRDVMEDYNHDSVIYEVLDQVPKIYHGKRGVKKMCKDVLGKVKNMELEHVAVNHNHAQVIWKGETEDSHAAIVGTDSFTFDENDHITSQTIVALTQEKEKEE